MTPISTHDGRLVVRGGDRSGPSPYLKSLKETLDVAFTRINSHSGTPKALDLGCGNGKNSEWLKGLGYEVLSFDQKPDYGYPIVLGRKPLPVFSDSVNVFLLQYVLMFLEPGEIEHLVTEILRFCGLF